MIGRNEAGTLAAALQSVRPFASEIIFVDTGSNDATQTIAAAYGAKVISFNWSDDFSKARNFALENCSCRWVLSLDCDEVVRPLSQTERFFSDLAKDERSLGYTVNIENRLPSGLLSSHEDIRLFRNIPEITYRNPIHESVSESVYKLRVNEPLIEAGFLIHHDGYASSERNREKLSRNLRILKRWIELSPDEPFAWYKLGMTLKAVSADESVACLFRSFELLLSRDDRNSFAFRFELVQVLVESLRGVDQSISQLIQSEGIRAFA
jgi:glycosyltransferase involved in cell wall biosynthesis